MVDAAGAALLAELRLPAASAEQVRDALDGLLELDRALGVAAAFDLLAGEPRIKPSQHLLIDPDNTAHRRWSHRVAAGAALLGSPAVVAVFDELRDELAEDRDLARDVLDAAAPHPDLPADHRAALHALAD